jgi:hypothetical protein
MDGIGTPVHAGGCGARAPHAGTTAHEYIRKVTTIE